MNRSWTLSGGIGRLTGWTGIGRLTGWTEKEINEMARENYVLRVKEAAKHNRKVGTHSLGAEFRTS